jgi:predicted acetyltransferase
MNVSHEQINLLEPTEAYRDEFLNLLDEHQRADENWPSAELARTDFTSYIRQLRDQSQGRDLPTGYVPMTAFWLVKNNQIILGESRLRHSLTPALEAYGGHIGYVIRLSQRRKGYGTLILKLTLEKARAIGIQRVRVTCDTDNIGSARIIERNGGMLSGYSVDPKNGKGTSQYWIEA